MNHSTKTTFSSLNNSWRVREAPSTDIVAHNQIDWIPATVPGHIHIDLMNAGIIGDPNVRMLERSVQWVDDADWIYETAFLHDLQADIPVYLNFKGLDTIATISLNGEVIGSTENMHMQHEFRVDHLLKTKTADDILNILQVRFTSAKRLGIERHNTWNAGPDGMATHWDTWAHRSMIRKAQYMYGWDWGPVLISCGIWQSVEIILVPVGRLLEWNHSFEIVDNVANVTVSNTVEIPNTGKKAHLSLRLTVGDTISTVPVPRESGVHSVQGSVKISNPELWQPNGVSTRSPTLYELTTELIDGDGEVIDCRKSSIGLRTTELLHERDSDGKGEGFQFRINGKAVFAKGANWIPNDSFPALTNTTRLEAVRTRLLQARDAGFNMLRVWGGGLYETDQFYEICDELGLMVWQDFAYGCAYYPDTGDYAKAAKAEAVAVVRRIRNHPSLVLWCGNNENHTMFHSNWSSLSPKRYLGECIYEEILPAVVAAECPTVPYWASSPSGGEDPNSEDFGDCHNWDVWHGRGDWIHYTENDSRFCSEFGFASSCGMPSWNAILNDSDRWPRSPVVKWHDKTRKGYETYLGFSEIHFPSIETLEDLVYYTQINQAEALKFAVEHYRRRKGRCWGTLFWQLNDCWPVQSWSIIDSLGDPKAAFYATKRFYAPLLVSLLRREGVTVHVINDKQQPVTGVLTVALMSFHGEIIDSQESTVTIESNSAMIAGEFSLEKSQFDKRQTLVFAKFRPIDFLADDERVENCLLLAEPKDLVLGETAPELHVEIGLNRTATVAVTASEFLPYVWIRRADEQLPEASDNFFHLLPGQSRLVVMQNRDELTAEEFKSRLLIRTL